MILDLLESSTDGSIGLDLSKVPDQWVLNLLSDLSDSDKPTVFTSTVADNRKPNHSKRHRHRKSLLRRARKRLRVVRKTLKQNVPETRSKLLN